VREQIAVDHAEMLSYPLLDLKWRRLRNYQRPTVMWRSSGESSGPAHILKGRREHTFMRELSFFSISLCCILGF